METAVFFKIRRPWTGENIKTKPPAMMARSASHPNIDVSMCSIGIKVLRFRYMSLQSAQDFLRSMASASI
jgi:hypothetical protein